MDRWSGKVAVVTGASAGIGATISLHLANAGLRVVGFARRTGLVDDLSSEVTGSGKIYSRKCDVSKPDEITASFAWVESKFGGVDILVNNAGLLVPGHITGVGDTKLSDADILSMMDTNFKGLVMCTRQAVESMKKRDFNGHVIHINSISGHYVPFASTFNLYPCTKHSVTVFTTALLNEFAEYKCKIKVTSISPGLVRSSMTASFPNNLPILEPEAIADCVVFALSSPANVNITELQVSPVGEKRL